MSAGVQIAESKGGRKGKFTELLLGTGQMAFQLLKPGSPSVHLNLQGVGTKPLPPQDFGGAVEHWMERLCSENFPKSKKGDFSG